MGRFVPERWEQMDVSQKLEDLNRRVDQLFVLLDVSATRFAAEVLNIDRRLGSVDRANCDDPGFLNLDRRLRSVERVVAALNALLQALRDKPQVSDN
jgi:hypothetical protein